VSTRLTRALHCFHCWCWPSTTATRTPTARSSEQLASASRGQEAGCAHVADRSVRDRLGVRRVEGAGGYAIRVEGTRDVQADSGVAADDVAPARGLADARADRVDRGPRSPGRASRAGARGLMLGRDPPRARRCSRTDARPRPAPRAPVLADGGSAATCRARRCLRTDARPRPPVRAARPRTASLTRCRSVRNVIRGGERRDLFSTLSAPPRPSAWRRRSRTDVRWRSATRRPAGRGGARA
jgi:hypothetical protein